MKSSSKHYLTANGLDQTTQLIGRSRAERQLDSIFNKQTEALRRQQLEKLSAKRYASINKSLLSSSTKKIKTENENSQKTQKPQKPPAAPKSPLEALNELIVKHIENNAKFPRAVELVTKLWNGYITNGNKNAFLCAIDKIINSDCCIVSPEGRKQVVKLFEDVVVPMAKRNICNSGDSHCINEELNVKKENNLENQCIKFNKEELDYLEILSIRGIYHNKLFTDDAFQFNRSMTYLKNIFEQLQNEHRNKMNQMAEEAENDFNEENLEEEEEINQDDEINDKTEEIKTNNEEGRKLYDQECDNTESKKANDMAENYAGVRIKTEVVEQENTNGDQEKEKEQDLKNGKSKNEVGGAVIDVLSSWKIPIKKKCDQLKKRLFFDSLKTVFQMRNVIWARSSVEGFFQNIYINRNIFDRNETDQISYWQSEIKSKTRSAKSFDTYKIGEAVNPVKDGREERFVTTHGSYIWSAKQTGA